MNQSLNHPVVLVMLRVASSLNGQQYLVLICTPPAYKATQFMPTYTHIHLNPTF